MVSPQQYDSVFLETMILKCIQDSPNLCVHERDRCNGWQQTVLGEEVGVRCSYLFRTCKVTPTLCAGEVGI